MRAFNLTEALAGKPVVTSNGCEVLELYLSKTAPSAGFPLVAWANGRGYFYDINGNSFNGTVPALRMKTQVITKWVNFYDSPSNHYTVHETENEANRAATTPTYDKRIWPRMGKQAHKITYEV